MQSNMTPYPQNGRHNQEDQDPPTRGWTNDTLKHFKIELNPQPSSFDEFFGRPFPEIWGAGLSKALQRQVRCNVSEFLELDPFVAPEAVDSVQAALVYKAEHIIVRGDDHNSDDVSNLTRRIFDLMGFDHVHPSVRIVSNTSQHNCMLYGDVIKCGMESGIMTRHERTKKILLVQESRAGCGTQNTLFPQLIAHMITAYKKNIREWNNTGYQDMYGITLLGTQHTFYKMHLTEELLRMIERGEGAQIATAVQWLTPESTSIHVSCVRARWLTLGCYEALRRCMHQQIDHSDCFLMF